MFILKLTELNFKASLFLLSPSRGLGGALTMYSCDHISWKFYKTSYFNQSQLRSLSLSSPVYALWQVPYCQLRQLQHGLSRYWDLARGGLSCRFFFNYFIYLFYFIILYWFCHTLTWICHECTCVLHPEPPSHLPPHPIPLGHPSAPALSTLSHASNLDWWYPLFFL